VINEKTNGVRGMNDSKHTVLCIDDEQNILHSLKRLLRKEDYRLLTASSGAEGLKILEENDVQVVIADQRMPQMSGTEFLAIVKEQYPQAMRIVLSGYADVDSITESINKGHIYKFFLKPWNDQSLKLEISQALDQYDLIKVNRDLHLMVLEQNEELKTINENLERLVQERTKELEIQNEALELAPTVLEDLPIPVIGVSGEGTIVLMNQQAQALSRDGPRIEMGRKIIDCFSADVQEKVESVLSTGTSQAIKSYRLPNGTYNIDLAPLSGRFQDKRVIMTFVTRH
jgi:DNA-binding NtrC family response regulator